MDDSDKDIYLRPVELLQKLIRFDTSNPPGNERDCIAYISYLLESVGIKCHLFSRDPLRPNLVARYNGSKGKDNTAALLLYGHIDVVPALARGWKYPPFAGTIAEGYVWGRGALDMKGAIAMMICAFMRACVENIELPCDIILCIFSDEEELGEYGARFMVEKYPDTFKGVKYALGEFGGFTLYAGGKKFYPIQVAEKQKCGIKAIIHGPGGHGSSYMPGGTMARLSRFLGQLDENLLPVHVTPVVEKMFNAMADQLPFPRGWMLRQLLNPRRTDFILKRLGESARAFVPMFRNTVNATVIKGGNKINVIPREIEVHLDVRILPGFDPDDVIRELRLIIGGEVELELMFYEPVTGEIDFGLFETLANVLKEFDPGGFPVPLLLTGCTDGRFLSRLGIQSYGFTPMQLPRDLNFTSIIHSSDERIPVEVLPFGTNAIFHAIQRIIG